LPFKLYACFEMAALKVPYCLMCHIAEGFWFERLEFCLSWKIWDLEFLYNILFEYKFRPINKIWKRDQN